MLRTITAALLSVAAIVVAADGVGASHVQELGSTTVDPKTGVATWSATMDCTPGDDVEIDVTITQRGDVAYTEAFSECPASGSVLVTADTRVEEGSDLLRPGPAAIHIDRIDYVASSGFVPVGSSTGGDIRIRAGGG